MPWRPASGRDHECGDAGLVLAAGDRIAEVQRHQSARMAVDLGQQQVLARIAQDVGDAFGGFVAGTGIAQRVEQPCHVGRIAGGGGANLGRISGRPGAAHYRVP